jgi:hypothetical protein
LATFRMERELCVIICRVGQNHIYIRLIYGNLCRDCIKYTGIYGVCIRFWPTLNMREAARLHAMVPFCICWYSNKVNNYICKVGL